MTVLQLSNKYVIVVKLYILTQINTDLIQFNVQ